MNLTDTHCHLDFEKFDADRPEVMQRAWEAGLTRILVPGISLPSSRATVKLAESHPNIFAAIGIHPTDSLTWDGQSIAALKALSISPKVAAIGEIGLDYYWNDAPPDHQRMVLREQLQLAAELELPVVLHLREKDDALEGACATDLIQILTEWVNSLGAANNPLAKCPGVLHSFSGSLATAEKAIQMNFYIGITGPITYKNADTKRKVVEMLPLERLLIETDAPFLAPVPQRGRRNEPAFVRHIADKIAEIHKINPEEVAQITSNNAKQLFSWGG